MAWGSQRALADRIGPIEHLLRNVHLPDGEPPVKAWECNPFRDPEEYAT